MDPSIMKLLEEDEDETMHSGADVEAFTAALNRDIEGDTSKSQPSDSESTALSQGSSYTSNQFLSQWQTSTCDENVNTRSQQDSVVVQRNEPQSTEMDLKQQGSVLENQKQPVESFQPQSDQSLLNVSQAMTMQNSENIPGHKQVPHKTQNLDHDPELGKLQNINNQQQSMAGLGTHQAVATGGSNQSVMSTGSSNQQASNINRGKQVPFALLLPVIQPQLDKDRAMQLNTLYFKLRKNEISKEGFVRHMRSIVGDQMLKLAVYKMQSQAAKNSQNAPSQLPVQSQAPSQQHQLPTPSTVQMMTDSSNQATDNNALKSREVETQSDSHGTQASQMSASSLISKSQDRDHSSFPLQGINKQQQQHMHFSQASFPAFGSSGSSYHLHSTTNTSSAAPTVKQLPHDSQTKQLQPHQSISTAQSGPTTQGMDAASITKFDQKRLHGATHAYMTNSSALPQKSVVPSSMAYVKQESTDQSNEQYKQLSVPHGLSPLSSVHPEPGNAPPGALKDESFEMQSSRVGFSMPTSSVPSNPISSSIPIQMEPNSSLNPRIPTANLSVALGNNAKAPKKPSVGQKKPLEAIGSPPPPSSKKQKVSGAFLDQSIEQLNDVTAVSGVNLREEEEQLFSGPKEDSRVSEASRRVVQEEEEKLILEKIPLQRKLAEIMAKSGLKNISNDVERCLSLCVEERMRGLICNLIRLSKQRLDIEKPRHKTIITSDVRQQIMSMNRKAREEWEKKQAESEKLQKLNEQPEGNPAVDGDKDKDESRAKAPKANKEEDDKMRTTAANVAARAAVGGDDMLSKWQLMAEQARQKREGAIDAASGSQPGKDTGRKAASARRDNQETDKRGQSASITPGAVRKVGRNQVIVPHPKVARSISVKDVIAVLEREPQMSKSTLMYRLYEKVRNDPSAE